MRDIVISSGHAKFVRGASGYLDEVDEARKVVDKVAEYARQIGAKVNTFHDDTSRTQSQNIGTIVRFHDSKKRDLDVSVHFNAGTKEVGGTEVLYVNPNVKGLAAEVSKAIADALGIKDRGAKLRTDLGFLNGTDESAILIEVCFVDTKSNADAYRANFDACCRAIAESITGGKIIDKGASTLAVANNEDYGKLSADDAKRLAILKDLKITNLEDPNKPTTQKYAWEVTYALIKAVQEGRLK
jgi:N-acetylmuramoyl-L-alanine amidase